MFYCEDCRVENNWPDSIGLSFGKCEVCGKDAFCNDVPSKQLPTKEGAAERLKEIQDGVKDGSLKIVMMGTPPTLKGEPDWTVTKTTLHGNFEVLWQSVSAGFGGMMFRALEGGGCVIDTEMTSKEFAKKVLCKMIDDATLDD